MSHRNRRPDASELRLQRNACLTDPPQTSRHTRNRPDAELRAEIGQAASALGGDRVSVGVALRQKPSPAHRYSFRGMRLGPLTACKSVPNESLARAYES